MTLSSGDRTQLAKLADPVRVHRELSTDSREPLRRALYDAHQACATIRELADATGMSRSAVHAAITREAADRQAVVLDPDTGA